MSEIDPPQTVYACTTFITQRGYPVGTAMPELTLPAGQNIQTITDLELLKTLQRTIGGIGSVTNFTLDQRQIKVSPRGEMIVSFTVTPRISMTTNTFNNYLMFNSDFAEVRRPLLRRNNVVIIHPPIFKRCRPYA